MRYQLTAEKRHKNTSRLTNYKYAALKPAPGARQSRIWVGSMANTLRPFAPLPHHTPDRFVCIFRTNLLTDPKYIQCAVNQAYTSGVGGDLENTPSICTYGCVRAGTVTRACIWVSGCTACMYRPPRRLADYLMCTRPHLHVHSVRLAACLDWRDEGNVRRFTCFGIHYTRPHILYVSGHMCGGEGMLAVCRIFRTSVYACWSSGWYVG